MPSISRSASKNVNCELPVAMMMLAVPFSGDGLLDNLGRLFGRRLSHRFVCLVDADGQQVNFCFQ